ncbi:MAG: hypothetical protein E7L01_22490 [Paenibacillus macerans]|uniref:Uncharacterized protein n=1 Tax=Paenibacillus macerans TaxID=44252 RepID=A0A6N8ER63_PAEMA|nr:hypothetical protein [Paenibacillus macerans]MDU7476079.1 hypothetical protein [Paenibacillus macerans]MED4954965.1 hypothetical protein [Paenibacillus macerans]MUG22034.1 hypothetical protein [Paenibacillus macerans]UMV47660.1 hypothetical protein LMZ02_30310 [Paenibacillus macerans]
MNTTVSETLFWLFIVAIIVFGARFSSNKKKNSGDDGRDGYDDDDVDSGDD